MRLELGVVIAFT